MVADLALGRLLPDVTINLDDATFAGLVRRLFMNALQESRSADLTLSPLSAALLADINRPTARSSRFSLAHAWLSTTGADTDLQAGRLSLQLAEDVHGPSGSKRRPLSTLHCTG